MQSADSVLTAASAIRLYIDGPQADQRSGQSAAPLFSPYDDLLSPLSSVLLIKLANHLPLLISQADLIGNSELDATAYKCVDASSSASQRQLPTTLCSDVFHFLLRAGTACSGSCARAPEGVPLSARAAESRLHHESTPRHGAGAEEAM